MISIVKRRLNAGASSSEIRETGLEFDNDDEAGAAAACNVDDDDAAVCRMLDGEMKRQFSSFLTY